MDDHGPDIPEQPRRGPWGAAAPGPEVEAFVDNMERARAEERRAFLAGPPPPRRRQTWLASMLVALLAMTVAFIVTVVLGVAWVAFNLPGAAVIGWAFPALCSLIAVRITARLLR